MNDDALEQELRAWYRAEIDESVAAPRELRDDVHAIPTGPRVRSSRTVRRPSMLLIAAAITITTLVGSAIAGSGILRPAPVAPPPSDAAVIGPSPSAAASILPIPSSIAPATPPPVLGGGPILAVLPHPGARACNISEAPFDVATIDPASGATTVLGTTANACGLRSFRAHWVAARTKIMLLGNAPQQYDLPTVTEAGRHLPVVCCDLPAYSSVWEDGGGTGQSWSVSPRGDRVAAVHTKHPGIGDGIVVSDIDGNNVRRLALPDGVDARVGFAWSPDESTIAITACRPCNTAEYGHAATADERWHLYLVPVDGSAVRTLLSTGKDRTASQPAWVPDGSGVAVVVTECEAGQTLPFCIERTRSSLAVVDVASGALQTIVPGTAFGPGREIDAPSWAPDGRRIRFGVYDLSSDRGTTYVVDSDGSDLTKAADGPVLAWSPDGEWFLVRGDPTKEAVSIGSIDGGPLRELGSFTAVDW